jgi:hypothetical protein
VHVLVQDLHEKYGPVVRTGPHSLSFSTPEAIEAIYGFNHGFEKGDFYAFAGDPATGASNILSARTYAEHGDRRRKVVGAGLTTSHIRSHVIRAAYNLADLLCRWSVRHTNKLRL